MPNPDEGLWSHWTEVISRKAVKVECNYCGKGRQLKNATKCRSHTTVSKNTKRSAKIVCINAEDQKEKSSYRWP